MPYQKNRTLEGMSGKGRAWFITGVTVAALLIVLLVFWIVNPRDFLRVFTTEHAYAKITVSQNGKKLQKALEPTLSYLGSEKAYQADGDLDWTMSNDIRNDIGDDTIATQVQDFVSTFHMNALVQSQDGCFVGNLTLKDDTATVFETDGVLGQGRLDLNRKQLYLGWNRVWSEPEGNGTTWSSVLDDRTRQLLADPDVQKELQKCIRKGIDQSNDLFLCSEQSDCDFLVENKRASGTRETISLSKKDLNQLVQRIFWEMKEDQKLFKLAEDVLGTGEQIKSEKSFSNYIQSKGADVLSLLEQNGINSVSVDLCLNRKNEVTAVNLLAKRDTADTAFNGILKEAEDKGPVVRIRTAAGNRILLNTKITDAQTGSAQLTVGKNPTANFRWSDLRTENGLLFGKITLDPVRILGNAETAAFAITLTPDEKADDIVKTKSKISFSSLGTLAFDGTLSSADYKERKIPFSAEVTEPTSEQLQKAWETYFYSTLAQSHPAWKQILQKSYSEILRETLSKLSEQIKEQQSTVSPAASTVSAVSEVPDAAVTYNNDPFYVSGPEALQNY